MSRGVRVTVEPDLIRVSGWRAADVMRGAGLRPVFARGAWLLDRRRLPDVLAAFEHRRVPTKILGEDT
jgi:hypothetical protein